MRISSKCHCELRGENIAENNPPCPQEVCNKLRCGDGYRRCREPPQTKKAQCQKKWRVETIESGHADGFPAENEKRHQEPGGDPVISAFEIHFGKFERAHDSSIILDVDLFHSIGELRALFINYTAAFHDRFVLCVGRRSVSDQKHR